MQAFYILACHEKLGTSYFRSDDKASALT